MGVREILGCWSEGRVKTVQVGKTFRVFNQLGSEKVVEKSVGKLERSHKGKYEDL